MSKVIAIIDDEQEMEFLYDLMLEDEISSGQIDLKFFSDSRDFLRWFEVQRPDLILTDLNMPHISGTELCRHVRGSSSQVPLYLVSGYEEDAYADVMKELQINRFLEKPLNYDRLLECIKEDLDLPGAHAR